MNRPNSNVRRSAEQVSTDEPERRIGDEADDRGGDLRLLQCSTAHQALDGRSTAEEATKQCYKRHLITFQPTRAVFVSRRSTLLTPI